MLFQITVMTNPFIEKNESSSTDKALVESAVKGDKYSLELLIKRHQAWIYNIALKMIWDPVDAEDITQEVLIKIITKLSSFRGDSCFRTWAYRIVANHVINMKKRKKEFEYTLSDCTAMQLSIRRILNYRIRTLYRLM